MFVRLDYTKDTDRAALKNFVLNEMIESVNIFNNLGYILIT